MKNKIYNITRSLLPKKYKLSLDKLKIGYSLVFSKYSYLVQTGYVNSVVKHSLTNNDDEYIPWMNYPLIDFLTEKLKKDLVVFEYGSGFSTVFFAKKTKKVISIEYDKEWYHKVNDMIIKKVDNAIVHFEELNDFYPNAIEKHMKSEKCDVVIIDGRMRVKCAKLAYKYLSERGVVFLDDTFREYYQEGIKFYKEKGFKSITFKGIKPTGLGTEETTLLYRTENCLGI